MFFKIITIFIIFYINAILSRPQFGVSFGGYHAEAGLGGILGGPGGAGGLFASAGTPYGQQAGAGLGGFLGGNDGLGGFLGAFARSG